MISSLSELGENEGGVISVQLPPPPLTLHINHNKHARLSLFTVCGGFQLLPGEFYTVCSHKSAEGAWLWRIPAWRPLPVKPRHEQSNTEIYRSTDNTRARKDDNFIKQLFSARYMF